MKSLMAWAPALVMGAGAVLTFGVGAPEAVPLQAPLEQVLPLRLQGLDATDLAVDEREAKIAGFDDYILRVYQRPDAETSSAGPWFQVYVGYYETQMQGRSIHTPRNCLPGSGWQVLTNRMVTVASPGGPVPVNRYLLQNGDEQVLVLYWYQGRGRVRASEYAVKWDLLRDAVLTGRTDEALVRIVVPIREGEDQAFHIAAQVVNEVVPAVGSALPEWRGRPGDRNGSHRLTLVD